MGLLRWCVHEPLLSNPIHLTDPLPPALRPLPASRRAHPPAHPAPHPQCKGYSKGDVALRVGTVTYTVQGVGTHVFLGHCLGVEYLPLSHLQMAAPVMDELVEILRSNVPAHQGHALGRWAGAGGGLWRVSMCVWGGVGGVGGAQRQWAAPGLMA